MANPQTENGYTSIAIEIVEKLATTHLSGSEWQIVWVVLRKTWGWQKKEDWISLSQFCVSTGLRRNHVCRAIRLLTDQRVITKGGTSSKPLYRFNKDFDTWKQLPKGTRSHHITKGGNQLVPKGVIGVGQKGGHTIDTITKETNTIRESLERTRKELIEKKILH